MFVRACRHILFGFLILLQTTATAAEYSAAASPAGLEILCRTWEKAVAEGNPAEAIRLAGRILDASKKTGDSFSKAKRLFFSYTEISPDFLQASFHFCDYQLWRRRWLFRQLSPKIVSPERPDEDIVKAVFSAVQTSLRKGDLKNRNQTRNLWPEVIWSEQAGYCDRQAWCASELLRQFGFQTMLIILFDEKNVSPHTILEANKDGRFYLLDTFCGTMRADSSFLDMRSEEKIRREFWPEQSRIQNAVKYARHVLPAAPQEFCLRNIRLAGILQSVRKKEYFLHIPDPVAEMNRYIRTNKISPQFCSFWTYPFHLLADDMKYEKTYSIKALYLPGSSDPLKKHHR